MSESRSLAFPGWPATIVGVVADALKCEGINACVAGATTAIEDDEAASYVSATLRVFRLRHRRAF